MNIFNSRVRAGIVILLMLVTGCQNQIIHRYQNMNPCEKLSLFDSLYQHFWENCEYRFRCNKYPYCADVNDIQLMPYIIEDMQSITGYFGHWVYTHNFSFEPSIYNDSINLDLLQWRKVLRCEEGAR
jgi:hypothetical protein